MAKASGSMIRATAKASPTGINRLDRSSTEGVQVMPPNHENLSVAVRIRAGRTFPGEVAIVEALTAGAVAGTQPPRSEVDVIALLVEVSEAVKRGNRAAVGSKAVEACPQEGEVVPEAVVEPGEAVAAAGLVAVEADGKNWVKMFNIINHKFDGGKGDAY